MDDTFIVVVDDDEEDIDVLKTVFHSKGNKTPIKGYQNGYSLLHDLENGMASPCLFIIDLNMPQIRGVELIPLLKANAEIRHTPVIVFTTSVTPKEGEILNRLEIKTLRKPDSPKGWNDIVQVMTGYCESHHFSPRGRKNE